jgi:predicted hotdog family 3-hydroxylacyl-ACP dehydratase
MLWVRTLCGIDAESVTCETVVDDAFAPFLDADGALSSVALMEIIAQSIGVWAGWHDKMAGRPAQSGMLLGCRQLRSAKPSFAYGARLRVEARKLVEQNGVGSFDARIFQDGAEVAAGTLTTYQTTWEHLDELLQR